jgi:hypothetical protein
MLTKDTRGDVMSEMINKRAEHKARARARDEERLQAGEITAIELQRENMPLFGKLRRDKVSFISPSENRPLRYLPITEKP